MNTEPETRKTKKSRTPINMEKIITIRRLKQSGQKTKFIAETLDLSISAVNKILKKIYDCEEANQDVSSIIKKSGPKAGSLDSPENIALAQIVQSDPTLTQKGMQEKLCELGFRASTPKISKTLRNLSITRKRIKKRSARTISADVINQRKVYAREMRLIPNSRILFLDESGFNLHTGVYYGYSPVNMDVHQIVPSNRGRNISLIALLSVNKINAYKLIDGAYNAAKLKDFLEESFSNESIKSNDIIVLDNVRFHHSEDVKEWCRTKNVIIKYLPPYSPDLNPIENIFSTIKRRYSNIGPIATTNGLLKQYVYATIESINNDSEISVEFYFERMRKFLTLAFNGDYF